MSARRRREAAAPERSRKQRREEQRRQQKRERKQRQGSAAQAPGIAAATFARATYERSDWLLIAAIVGAALAVRLVYVFQLQASPLFEHPISDALYHDRWAAAIVSGQTFVPDAYFRAPLYPMLLALVYQVAGHEYLAPRIVQSLLGAASCGLVFALGRLLFDRRVAALAGFAAASYWVLVYYDGELLIPSLIVFLDLLTLWLLARAVRAPGRLAFGGAGLAMGLSAIARPNILLFAPAVVAWMAWLYRAERRRAVVYVAALTAGCLLAVLPVTVRNHVVSGEWVLIASQGGVNFYIGNNPQSDGMTAKVPGTPGDFFGGHEAQVRRAEAARGRELSGSEVSDYYLEESLEFVAAEPGAFLGLLAKKARYFWSRWEIPNNKSLYFWTEKFTPVVAWLPLGFGLVGPLALVGLAFCHRRAAALFPLWGFVLVYMVSVVIFFTTARFRVPVLPALLLLAAFAVFETLDAFRARGLAGVVPAFLLLIPAALLVDLGGQPGKGSAEAISYELLAHTWDEQGRPELAEQNYRESLRYDPEFLLARYNLGTHLSKAGRFAEAIAEFERALELTPRIHRGEDPSLLAAAHNSLAAALHETGRSEEAVRHLRQAIEGSPAGADLRPRRNLAAVLASLGRREEAVQAYLEVVERAPRDRTARLQAAALLRELRRDEEAAGQLAAALADGPDDVDVRLELADALRACGRGPEAVATLREGIRIGGGPRVRNNLAWLLATHPEPGLRDPDEALRLAHGLCPELERCDPPLLDTLAAALARGGDLAEAGRVARIALEDIHGDARYPPEAADAIRSHLAAYESGRPWTEP